MEKQYSNEDVKQVADVLKQLVSCNPQLLFRAAQELSTELSIECIQEQLQPTPNKKRLSKLQFRAGLCMALGKILLNSGQARLSQEDLIAIAQLAPIFNK